MICPKCASLHFDGAFQRCMDCRTIDSMEQALVVEVVHVYGNQTITRRTYTPNETSTRRKEVK